MKYGKLFTSIFVLVCLFLFITCVSAAMASHIRVQGSNGDDSYDGSSWTHPGLPVNNTIGPFASIYGAINYVNQNPGAGVTQIWVSASGPLGSNGWYTSAATLPSGVQLLGGFNGEETSVSQRDYNRRTCILTSPAATISIPAGADANTAIDGFYIEGDQRETNSPIISDGGSHATISHNVIYSFGAMRHPSTNDYIILLAAGHQIIKDNLICGCGRGVSSGGGALIVNNTFHCRRWIQNDRSQYIDSPPALAIATGDVFANNIVWNADSLVNGGTISVSGSPSVVSNYYGSLVGGTPVLSGNNYSSTSDPGFASAELIGPSNLGFLARIHLTNNATHCLDMGATTVTWNGQTVDLTGQTTGTPPGWMDVQNSSNCILGDVDYDGQLRAETDAARGYGAGTTTTIDIGADEYYAPPSSAPTLSQTTGVIPQWITITPATPPTTDYLYNTLYTEDGNTPDPFNGCLYLSPFNIPQACTVKARTFYRATYNSSPTASTSYP